MQIFIAMDYLILMLQMYLHFKKQQKHEPRDFLSPRRGNFIHLPKEMFFELCASQRSVQKLKRNWNF